MWRSLAWTLAFLLIVTATLIIAPQLRGFDVKGVGGVVSWLRWGIAALLLLSFALCSVANISIIIECVVRRRFVSRIPLVGGIAGAAALLIAPIPALHWWWWSPLLLDVGCLPDVMVAVANRMRRKGGDH